MTTTFSRDHLLTAAAVIAFETVLFNIKMRQGVGRGRPCTVVVCVRPVRMLCRFRPSLLSYSCCPRSSSCAFEPVSDLKFPSLTVRMATNAFILHPAVLPLLLLMSIEGRECQ